MNHGFFDIETLSGMSPLRKTIFCMGSNLGDRLEYLQGGVDHLRTTPGLEVVAISSIYETSPVDLLDQPDFLNLVVAAESTLASTVMLERALAIEAAFSRVREQPRGPRTLDIDLIAVGDRQLHSEILTLPHPRAHQRGFVLVPWHEIDPDAVLVGHGRVADLVALADTDGVHRRDDLQVE